MPGEYKTKETIALLTGGIRGIDTGITEAFPHIRAIVRSNYRGNEATAIGVAMRHNTRPAIHMRKSRHQRLKRAQSIDRALI